MVVTGLPYGDHVPDSPEGACSCSAAAVVVAWVCVGFAAVVAALAESVMWTVVTVIGLVVTVACTLAAAERTPFRADSTPATGVGPQRVVPKGVGEDDERVGRRRDR